MKWGGEIKKHVRCTFLYFCILYNSGHLVLFLGYVEALVIPAGARRIKVVEEKPAHSYLGECPKF